MSSAILLEKTAVELSDLLGKREITSEEITKAFLKQINRIDDQVHAFLHLDEQDFLTQAKDSDKRRAQGNRLVHWTESPWL